jgi:hypothetical protein
MSRAWSWRNAILKSTLPATTKHVLMVISCHMNDMGEGCYPSTKRIAEYASLSERSVCTHIEEAGNAGWLEVKTHGYSGQGWARHEYRPLWPEGTELDSAPSAERTEPRAQGTEPNDNKALKEVQRNISGEQLIKQPSKFDVWWEAYPNKVGKKVCQLKWKTLKLDAVAADVMAGLARWKASHRWARGYIKDPLTFLNQEIWREAPPLEIKPVAKGEVRVRESTPAEKLEANGNAEFMRLLKLPENLRKTPDEIAAMIEQNGSVM